jgi:hypothetical protein
MDDTMGALIIARVWNAANKQPTYRICWTTEQLRRIGQAVKEDDAVFLATIEQAMRQALETALTPARG